MEVLETLKGKLLVANPEMKDPHFANSVVLVLDHGPNKALGVALNVPRAVQNDTDRLWNHYFTDSPLGTIYCGGPVTGLMLVHNNPQFPANEVIPGIFVTSNELMIHKIGCHSPFQWKLFVGAALWQAGQLEVEIANNYWTVIDADRDLIFEQNCEVVYNSCSRIANNKFLTEVLGIKHIPKDIRCN